MRGASTAPKAASRWSRATCWPRWTLTHAMADPVRRDAACRGRRAAARAACGRRDLSAGQDRRAGRRRRRAAAGARARRRRRAAAAAGPAGDRRRADRAEAGAPDARRGASARRGWRCARASLAAQRHRRLRDRRAVSLPPRRQSLLGRATASTGPTTCSASRCSAGSRRTSPPASSTRPGCPTSSMRTTGMPAWRRPRWQRIRRTLAASVFTVHNLAFQGLFPHARLRPARPAGGLRRP